MTPPPLRTARAAGSYAAFDCPLSGVTRKCFARSEVYRLWPTAHITNIGRDLCQVDLKWLATYSVSRRPVSSVVAAPVRM